VVPGEVVISPLRRGEFLVSNPSTRTHAVGDSAFLELLASPGEVPDAPVRVRDASRPPFEDGLLEDPSGLDRTATLQDTDPVSAPDGLALARRLMLVVDDAASYREYLTGRRLNVIDRAHLGNIHQRVGEYVLMRLRRSSVDEWWVEQKFTEDRREPRAGLYRDVQPRPGWGANGYWTSVAVPGCSPGCSPPRARPSSGSTSTPTTSRRRVAWPTRTVSPIAASSGSWPFPSRTGSPRSARSASTGSSSVTF
jgi:hypothetical protein